MSTASPVSRAAQDEHVVVHRADHDLVDLGVGPGAADEDTPALGSGEDPDPER
jgi:hypothetical protein